VVILITIQVNYILERYSNTLGSPKPDFILLNVSKKQTNQTVSLTKTSNLARNISPETAFN